MDNFAEIVKINDNNVMAFLNGGIGNASGWWSDRKITIYLYNKHSADCGWDAPIKAVEISQLSEAPYSNNRRLVDFKRYKCNMEMTNTHLIIGKTIEGAFTSGVIVYKLNYSGSAVTGMTQVATYSNYGSVAINDNYFLIGNGTNSVKGYKIDTVDSFTNIINFGFVYSKLPFN